ncbi:unnamed protein product [Protopolystoma xenopodis]|uniref:Uncharacterized protein n=1 Tax=Protopolystoma xenopodis TaxID=117903 RepID=A0A3S5C738_9PLAT|nr:unnamed protein product [Protopolystoma xenopodis]
MASDCSTFKSSARLQHHACLPSRPSGRAHFSSSQPSPRDNPVRSIFGASKAATVETSRKRNPKGSMVVPTVIKGRDRILAPGGPGKSSDPIPRDPVPDAERKVHINHCNEKQDGTD